LAAVCFVGKATLLTNFNHHSIVIQIITLMITITFAGAAYFGVNVLLKNEEVEDIKVLVLRKLRRR
jgi:hypothetical protein